MTHKSKTATKRCIDCGSVIDPHSEYSTIGHIEAEIIRTTDILREMTADDREQMGRPYFVVMYTEMGLVIALNPKWNGNTPEALGIIRQRVMDEEEVEASEP